MKSTRWVTQTLAEHSCVLSLLPEEAPIVLDIGCRDFEFCRAVLKERPSAQIIALDPDPEIEDPKIDGVTFLPLALVHDDRRSSNYAQFGSNGSTKGYGNYLTEQEVEHQDTNNIMVGCVNILQLMFDYRIFHWDLVKLDCEGSEFAILENWPGRCATQLSVEFHDKRKKISYGDLFKKLDEYDVVQHDAFDTAAGFGHWDSVFVLKER